MKTTTNLCMRVSLLVGFLILPIATIRSQEAPAAKYLPVVLVHGFLADQHDMKPVEDFIAKYMPGTYVKNIKLGLGLATSFWNMFTQGEWLASAIQSDPNLANGFNIIAHSQGGLVARYYIERYNKPLVHTYISWATPEMGVFGTPGTYDNRFAWLNYLETITYRLLYSSLWQSFTSIAGYWRDTLHYDAYLAGCAFLPSLNNENDHVLAGFYKHNICSLHNMVCVQSPLDDIIEPLESCHFGFYPIGSKDVIESLTDSQWYKDDKLGLRTLNESGRLHLKIGHCTHTGFQTCEQNFVDNTLPFLILEPVA